MANEASKDHLTPETFVDLLDGTPVEAELRLHLRRCPACRQELAELEQTLDRLKAEEEAGESHPPTRASRPLPWRFALWASAAAAVLFALVLSLERGRETVDSSTPQELEMLLPPIEEDEDFRLLLALSDAAEEEDFPDWHDSNGLLAPDASGLTAAERQNLLEELTRDMRSSS